MAPIKFEEHIREQLEKREIQPSASSWEKLNAKLDNSGSKKSSKWWLGVAAAVVVCLIASLFFINQQNQKTTPVVNNPVEVRLDEKSVEFVKPVQVASEEKQSRKVPEKVKQEKAAEKFPQETKKNDQTRDEMVSAEIVRSEVKTEEKSPVEENKIATKAELSSALLQDNEVKIQEKLINSKIDELVARVAEKERDGEEISDAEVDALLAQAAKELSRQRDFYAHGSVDANELLAQVESEIDQSFRQEVFELLKEGFIKAKTAIVSRNY